MASVWRRLLGVGRDTVVERVEFDDGEGVVVAHVRPRKGYGRRCGRCGERAGGYDRGEGRRRWRGLDLGSVRVCMEGEAPRVSCGGCGVTVARVPWARHRAGHTRDFDDTVAWLAVRCSKTAITELMRVAWPTVGSIIARVEAERGQTVDRLKGISRIGIDEVSYKRGHHYLTVVVDLVSGRLVWAAPGRNEATLHRFFDLLGEVGCEAISQVAADGADWIERVVRRRCPRAVLGLDPFHLVTWAMEAMDQVRRDAWNEARGGRPQPGSLRRVSWPRQAHQIKRVKWALWKNPERLTQLQRHQLAWIAGNHSRLWRAYRLKEGLRYVVETKGVEGKEALDRWLGWATRSQLRPFIELARTIRRYRPQIDATLEHGLTNALAESTNAKIRLLTRVAYGFHGPQPLIALAMLALGGTCPPLPGRHKTHG